MALDGFAISSIINELKETILGGRIDKVYQPEKDEIILQIRSKGKAYKLLLTANATSPRIHFTQIPKENPLNAPLFCMVLRKHLTSGRIIDITQPNFERIVNIHVESIDELGDYSEKVLAFEIMGRHSNIILLKNNDVGNPVIVESIKHISYDVSAVRSVLPTYLYDLPPTQDKINPLTTTREEFLGVVNKYLESNEESELQEAIYKSYTGVSPTLASEIVGNRVGDSLESLYDEFDKIISLNNSNSFKPQVIYEINKKDSKENSDKIIDFTVFDFNKFSNVDDYRVEHFETMSELLEFFYKSKDLSYRLSQKTSDLRKFLSQNIERCQKKKVIQQKTLKDIENRDTLKLYGELVTSNIYAIKKGMQSVTLNNFYSEDYEEIEIKLDVNLTPAENAQKYFKKYNKEKRTFVALQDQIVQNDEEIVYLESVLNSVATCLDERDILEIRQELYEEGFIKRVSKNGKNNKKNNSKKAKPLHYISTDGFDIYVGKNNTQNDELTLKFAKSLDMWLHTKNIAGSHVIIVAGGREISEDAINQGANLAVYYSKASKSSGVAVDYTLKKYVKKPNGAKPGMVIYETNKTAYITPNEELINSLKQVD